MYYCEYDKHSTQQKDCLRYKVNEHEVPTQNNQLQQYHTDLKLLQLPNYF
jgi:hypothetical protein